MKLKTIDLCAGIGGIRRGFELAGGYRNIASAEIDEMACKTYEHLFHEDPRNDVTNEKFKKHLQTLHYDVLMAGFPCQAFSSVGLQHGFEDKTKGTIFFDIAKIIKMTRPKVVFLENAQIYRRFGLPTDTVSKLPEYGKYCRNLLAPHNRA
jgi:DNA (cytosine-5)-methyltransferase 1